MLWKDGNYKSSLSIVNDILLRSPNSGIMKNILQQPHVKLPEYLLPEFMGLIARTRDLTRLNLSNYGVRDLTSLAGMKLTYLNCSGNELSAESGKLVAGTVQIGQLHSGKRRQIPDSVVGKVQTRQVAGSGDQPHELRQQILRKFHMRLLENVLHDTAVRTPQQNVVHDGKRRFVIAVFPKHQCINLEDLRLICKRCKAGGDPAFDPDQDLRPGLRVINMGRRRDIRLCQSLFRNRTAHIIIGDHDVLLNRIGKMTRFHQRVARDNGARLERKRQTGHPETPDMN